MKIIYTILYTLFISSIFGQSQVDMQDIEMKSAVSMSDASGKYVEGTYRYFKKGEDKPFSGTLYAKWSNGNYKSIQEFINGLGEGEWTNYYEDGLIREKGTYRQNRVEGPIEKYHKNGQLSSEGEYKEWRIRVGKWKFYDKNGSFIKEVDYGDKGDITDVQAFYDRREIPLSQLNKNKKRIEQ